MAEHAVAGGSFHATPFPGVPELELIGRTRFAKAYHGLAEHDHDGALEVLSIRKGRQTFCVGTDEYTMRGGECVIFPPGVAHSTGGRPQGKAELRWMHIGLESRKPFFGSRNHAALRTSLRGLPVQVARFGDDLWDALGRLYDMVSEDARPTTDSHVTALCLFSLHRLIEMTAAGSDTQRATSIAPALDLMRARVSDRLGVKEMAGACGYAESAFITAFTREIGMPPAEHFLRMKLEHAAGLLRDSDKSVTDIALGLGFSSTQYFATAFKRHNLVTPTQWRKGGR